MFKYIGSKEFIEVYCKLIETAKKNSTVSYSEIASILGITSPGNYMGSEVGKVVEEISIVEALNRRPMLNAVVVTKETGLPGKGFFELAMRLGKLAPQDDEKDFWERELQEVYNTWK